MPELDDASLREVIEALYRIYYRLGVDSLDILTVVHAARRFPTEALSPSP